MATAIKDLMQQGRFKIYYVPKKSLNDVDIPSELNIERYELMKSGQIKFGHPEGTHDDVFWAVCLAVYAAVKRPFTRGLVDTGELRDKV